MGASSGVTGPALEHAKAALGELESSASPERLAALLIDIYNIAFAAEAFDTAWITARRLHGLVDELHASRLQVDALIVVADERWSTGHLREALGLDERAMETARTLNDDRAWAVSACERAAGLATGGRTGEAEALVDTAAALYPGFDGSARTFASAISSCWVLLMTGRFEDSVRLAADARRAAIRYGVERRQGRWFQANEAHALFELGRLDEAARLARSAGEHRYLGTWTVIAKIEAVRGRFDAAREALRTDDLWNGALWRLETETFIERAAGNFDGVRAGIDQAEAERRTSELVAPVWPLLGTGVGAAADHALMARRRRRRAAAAEAVGLGRDWLGRLREIVEHGRANGGAGRFCEATLATAEGEMERLEERFDPATWSNAARQWRALSHPYGTAHAELRLSEVLLELDADRDEVARLLRGAYAATITLGAVPLRREIETVARQAKITIAPEPAVPADGSAGPPATEVARSLLTARERDVLRLVAEGHTNREIGDRLFISEKTASVHVSNAMSKLGALSRYEAAAAAERTGQLS